MDWRAALAGLVVGQVVGMTGIGAGSLMMPLLILWLGVPPLQAVGSDLVYSSVTKAVAAVQHARLRTVDYRTVGRMAAGSVPVGVAVAWWVTRLGTGSAAATDLLTQMVGGVLILAAAVILWQLVRRRPVADVPVRAGRWVLGVAGAMVGGVVGSTSVGSGSFGTALLSLTTRLRGPRIVGTVTAHALVITLASALTHLALGSVRLELVGSLLLGSVPGVVLGSRWSVRVPEPMLRGVLAVLLLVLGLRMQLSARSERAAVAARSAAPHLGAGVAGAPLPAGGRP